MFKQKKLIILLLLFVILLEMPAHVMAKGSSIDKNLINQGVIIINHESKDENSIKVMISKGKKSYTYDLNTYNHFPLQLGNGDYSISILEKVKDNKYRSLVKEDVKVSLSNSNDVYLQSIQLVKWDNNMNSIKKAKQLTKGKKSELEKVEAIYKYIISNIKYDNKKAKTVSNDYLPSIDQIYKSNKGICYDYSSLFAGMLRSVGIPTKLVMGYKSDIKSYHAWNEVYIAETNEWIVIDTTYDSGSKSKKVSMDKLSSDYTISKAY